LSFYGQVAGWLSRAQQALHNEHYEIDLPVPARIPGWAREDEEDGERWPRLTQVVGLSTAMARLEAHADRLTLEGIGEPKTETAARAYGIIRQVRAEAAAAADYARALGLPSDPTVLAEIESQVRIALDRLYLYGQLVALPELALAPLPKASGTSRPGEPQRLPLPGEPNFDPWCLTDPRIVDRMRKTVKLRHQLDALWNRDPDPARTLALKTDIDAGLVRHRIGYAVGHYGSCPWAAIYVAKQRLRIGRVKVDPLEEFTICLEPGRGRQFRRAIVVGPFHPAG
jgi:hypothetical protein